MRANLNLVQSVPKIAKCFKWSVSLIRITISSFWILWDYSIVTKFPLSLLLTKAPCSFPNSLFSELNVHSFYMLGTRHSLSLFLSIKKYHKVSWLNDSHIITQNSLNHTSRLCSQDLPVLKPRCQQGSMLKYPTT